MRYLTYYNCKELDMYRKSNSDIVRSEIYNLNKINKDLFDIYNKLSESESESEYNKCNIFDVKILKLSNSFDVNNRMNIIKLFNNLHCTNDIHFMQLVLAKNTNNKYYKVNKELLKSRTNIIGIITLDMIKKWYKGHVIKYEISYEKLYIENSVIFKIYI